jgi:hypothetical protein
MKFLAIEKELPTAAAGQFAPLLKAEAQRVWELSQFGALREIYFGQDQHNAILILECNDLAQANTLLESLPLVQAGLIRFEVTVLIPYSGFERLFS